MACVPATWFLKALNLPQVGWMETTVQRWWSRCYLAGAQKRAFVRGQGRPSKFLNLFTVAAETLRDQKTLLPRSYISPGRNVIFCKRTSPPTIATGVVVSPTSYDCSVCYLLRCASDGFASSGDILSSILTRCTGLLASYQPNRLTGSCVGLISCRQVYMAGKFLGRDERVVVGIPRVLNFIHDNRKYPRTCARTNPSHLVAGPTSLSPPQPCIS